METKYKIVIILSFIAVIYLLYQNSKIKETMVNTESESIEDKIKEHVNKIYLADINAIRNLSKISTELQKGSLKIPGNLTVEGELVVNKNSTVKGNSDVKGQTTINSLYGGQSTGGGWRDIIVNGGHLRFVTGSNKFGIHNNSNGLHFYRGNTADKLPIYKGIHAKGHIHVDDHLSTRRLDVRNDRGKGTTHFNYAHKGDNYIRGDIKDKLTKDGKHILKRGDKVRLQSHGGWHKKGGSAHYGLHISRNRDAVTWYGGDAFALE
jgi:hypothetical protein